jgi:hypothetical protein
MGGLLPGQETGPCPMAVNGTTPVDRARTMGKFERELEKMLCWLNRWHGQLGE